MTQQYKLQPIYLVLLSWQIKTIFGPGIIILIRGSGILGCDDEIYDPAPKKIKFNNKVKKIYAFG